MNIYISETGSDTNTGERERCTPGQSDGPLASFEAARNKARERIHFHPGDNIRILFLEGTYRFTQTVVFGPEDSRAQGETRIMAKPGHTVYLSSAVPLKEWEPVVDLPDGSPANSAGKLWAASLPANAPDPKVLYDGFERIPRTRSAPIPPVKTEYKRLRSFNVARKEDRHLLKKVPFPAGSVGSLARPQEAEVFFTPVPWELSILPVESIDLEQNVIHTSVEGTVPAYFKLSMAAWLENMIEDIKPGTWCSVRKTGRIYYCPKDGAPGEDLVVPALRELVRVEGAIDYAGEDIPVRGIHFEGLTFCHGDRDTRENWHKGRGLQHDWDVFDRDNALLRFRGAEECSVDSCRFTASGGSAVRLDLYCQNIAVTKSCIDYVGGFGILLCGYGPGTKDVNNGNSITNNLIHHTGEITRHGHAVFLFQSGGNTIANNRIHHVPRKAIGLNGVRLPMLERPDITWDDSSLLIRWQEIEKDLKARGEPLTESPAAPEYSVPNRTSLWKRLMPYLHTKDNHVEYNDVYRALEDLGDGSAINVSGAGEGNNIRRNFVHHIKNHTPSGCMRVDDWQSGTTFSENVLYMANVSGIVHKNYNHIERNIFVDLNGQSYVRFASYPDEEPAYGSVVRRNVYYESGPDVEYYKLAYVVSDGISKPENCDTDYNIFYCAVEAPVRDHFDRYRKKGVELHSVAMAPFKGDPGQCGFTLTDEAAELLQVTDWPRPDSWGLKDDFPRRLLEFDFVEEEVPEDYHRGRDPEKKLHDFW